MIASTQITNTEILAFIAAIVFKLSFAYKHERFNLFNLLESRLLLNQISWVNYCKVISNWNATFSGYL